MNLLRTPERPNRFNKKLNNFGNDESPILSQEPVGITWKWANEGTPIRTTNKTSKLRATKQIIDEMDTNTMDTNTINLMCEPETHSPKGLYKFQEEMRKIQFDTESDMPCDNISHLNISSTPTNAKDTGYPNNVGQCTSTDTFPNNDRVNNYNNNSHGSAIVMSGVKETIVTTATTATTANNNVINEPPKKDDHQMLNDSLANDLLNDSDFDQMLLTCTERVEKSASECSQSSVKNINATPETKIGSGSSSEWSLFIDDGADDLLCNIDIDIPISDSLNNSKFTRHKSMPQQQPILSSNAPVPMVQPSQKTGRFKPAPSRKSFTRHESFPITNSFQNRLQKPHEIRSTQMQDSNPGEHHHQDTIISY